MAVIFTKIFKFIRKMQKIARVAKYDVMKHFEGFGSG